VPRALYRSDAASLALDSTVGGVRYLIWSRVLMSHRFVEEASTRLDHSSVKMTEVYAERATKPVMHLPRSDLTWWPLRGGVEPPACT